MNDAYAEIRASDSILNRVLRRARAAYEARPKTDIERRVADIIGGRRKP